MRYVRTSDELLIAGSEAGMVPQDEAKIVEKGRLGPGEMLAVDMDQPLLYKDRELKDMLAETHDYASWTTRTVELDSLIKQETPAAEHFQPDELRRRQFSAGWSIEDLEMILHPMVEDGKEAIGSMGDDAPLAVLSDTYRGMHHYFRQNFSQVTNPPIDSLRERNVMTIRTRLGNLGNILDESPEQSEMLSLQSPIVLNAEFEAMRKYMGETACRIDCTFDARGGLDAMRQAFERICKEAEDGVRSGCLHVVLTDANVNAERAALPMILAAGCVHSFLVRQSLRTFTSLNVRSGECLDVHYAAVIIGVGATTVNPYLAEETIAARHARGLFGKLTLGQCLANYKKALDDGLLKVMSKMGISVLSSYRGGCNFEAVGLSRSLVAEFFPGMPSRISGIGLRGVQEKIAEQHARAFDEDVVSLPIGGFYKTRRGGDRHNFEGNLIHMLQDAVNTESYAKYRRYSEQVRRLPPINLRDLLDFKTDRTAVAIDEVESITELRKRLVAPGISLGALGPEAHETLSIAMNRIGAKSDSGEGGEDPARYKARANGDNASSAIKQVASGRFGVTAEYLNNCRELEIKVAQGAKPGEGGQLPGLKVSEMIARLRHSTPGVTLISPPPHHDIYSIEDLAQLIYDLKQINPEARVTVKLVARSGIGTIAAGVAKAKADVILVSGHSGGTGASPQTSIKYAGIPWEMGLSETHQVLTLNRLREKVLLRTDGGLKTGRDVVIAAMLGAEEYGIGTASLIAMGCIMVRQCHSNTCPVGVCSQDPKLRAKFAGTPEKVVNLFSFIAEEVREILAQLGYRSLIEIVGRSDLLRQVSRGARYLDDLDLNPLLTRPDGGREAAHSTVKGRNEVPDTLDAQMIRDAQPLFTHREKMQLQYSVRNTHRAVGTRLSRHDHAQVRHGGAAARHRDGAPARHRRPVARRLRRARPQARSVRRRQRLCRQGPERRHHRGQAHRVEQAGARAQRHHRQHGPLRRHRRQAVRLRPRRRALRRPQLRRRHGGRGRGLQRLRIHDRRHGGDPGSDRRQLRRRHDRRHGLRLRPGERLHAQGQSRERELPEDRPSALGGGAEGHGRGACRRDQVAAGRAPAERLEPLPRAFLAGGAQGDAVAPAAAADDGGSQAGVTSCVLLGARHSIGAHGARTSRSASSS